VATSSRAQELARRVDCDVPDPEVLRHLRGELVEAGRAPAGGRPRAERGGQQGIVVALAPGKPHVGHLGGGEGAGRLRGGEQREVAGRGVGPDRGELGRVGGRGGRRERSIRVGSGATSAPRGLRLDVEERVAVIGRARDRRAPVGAGRATLDARQEAVDEPQVVASLDAHAGGEQRRIPQRRVGPDPARMLRLALGDERRQLGLRRERARAVTARSPRVVHLDEGDLRASALDHDRHALSLPCRADAAPTPCQQLRTIGALRARHARTVGPRGGTALRSS
jgi:hypothetical protein